MRKLKLIDPYRWKRDGDVFMGFKVGELVIAKFNKDKHYFVKGKIDGFHEEFTNIVVEETNIEPTNIKRIIVFVINLHHIIEPEVVQFT